MLKTISATLAALCALTVPGMAPAEAAEVGSGSISNTDGVLYPGCTDHPYRYDLALPPGTRDWTLDVSFRTPDGLESGSDYLFSYPEDPEPTSGTSTHLVCGSELAGRWSSVATLETCDYDAACSTTTIPGNAFTMRKPLTRTSVAVSPRRPRVGDVVKFKVTSRDERPRGFFGTDYARVHLERKQGKHWVKVKGSKASTSSNGRSTVRFRWTPSSKAAVVRAVTQATSATQKSTSRPVRVG